MQKPQTISAIPSDQETDYGLLYREGIEILQQLAGKIWTDYNEHDPGVTILENLCYVLTELYERTTISVPNLLTRPDGKMDLYSNALYPAPEILQNAPVTPADYRKFIIDRIPEASNAWVIPYYAETKNGNYGITGMYKVLIDLEENVQKSRDIEENARLLLLENRKLSETFPSITVLDQLSISISFDLQVHDAVMPEKIIADVLFNISNYLKPQVEFSSYEELAAKGLSADEIYDGPALLNGFIANDQLTEKITSVYVDNLLKLIIGTGDIINVTNLFLISGSKKTARKFNVPKSSSLLLNLGESLKYIRVYKKGTQFYFNTNLVISLFNQLRSKRKRKGAFLRSATGDLPQGKFVDPSAYYSLQNDFPLIYGIGKDKLARTTPGYRKAQALQLKSYLLFFEQLLSDFMAQTANLRNIFSVKKQEQTYFYQPLYSVPDIAPLLKGYSGDPAEIYDENKGSSYISNSGNFVNNPHNEYIKGLESLYTGSEDFHSRRNLFLDHLLARFCFVINPLPAMNPNPDKTETLDHIAGVKQQLLQNMENITALRGQVISPYSANPTTLKYTKSTGNFLHMLSGIKYGEPEKGPADQYKLIRPVKKGSHAPLFGKNNNKEAVINSDNERFREIIQDGLSPANYKTIEKDDFRIFYLKEEKEEFRIFTQDLAKDQRDKDLLIGTFTDDFLRMLIRAENIYIVEHLLLKPDNSEKKFTWTPQPATAWSDLSDYETILAEVKASVNALAEGSEAPVIGIVEDELRVHQDFYSSRLSVLIPSSAIKDKSDKSYQEYFRSVATSNTPANTCMEIFWMDEDEYEIFIGLLEDYIRNKSGVNKKILNFFFQKGIYTEFLLS